ncbi:MAG: acyl-CoA dehydrogenase family protein [Candidatus Eisenbacteria bacterium]|uniref:Acyl-CoA dehydrogenase family protein n=1 Tax=Eiseniibacteriota bacterium TaxID=2212470 RepID=A0A956NCG4_UNCEI|nr:acyl-CoA dehydrogenase family protein [Candidatus Eisenbacteria bacterium]
MSGLLNDENKKWQAKAREVAEEVVRPLAAKYDQLQEYPWEIKDAMAQAGLMGVWIPEEYGGAGAGVLNLCLCVEELSRACGGIGVAYAVNALGSFPILVGGTDEQKKTYLPKIASGESLIAFGLSEKTAGSDAGSMRSQAVETGDHYVINGEKKWCTNGGVADLYTVFAVSDPESKSRRISAFMLEKGMDGFTIGKIEDKMGIRAVPVVELHLKDVKVPKENLLGGKAGVGFKHAMMTLDRARPGVAAQAVGLAQGALEYATLYATGRQQFGSNLSGFQMIQDMLAKMATKVEAARQLVYAAARAIDAGEGNITKLAAMAKANATDTAMEVTTDAVQIFGGYGFMKDYPVEKYMRDAKITQIYEGTNQIQRVVIARNLIKESGNFEFLRKYIPTEVQNAPLP